jgi:GcrA cell cycle regulator
MTLETPWTPDTIAQLRQMWADGVSTPEIGRRLGVSKNSAVGKIHRLHLPPRPSPIRPRTGDQPKPRPRAALRGTLPPSTVIPVDRVREIVVVGQRVRECCWIDGQRGAWLNCDQSAIGKSSYCGHHHSIAYLRRAA